MGFVRLSGVLHFIIPGAGKALVVLGEGALDCNLCGYSNGGRALPRGHLLRLPHLDYNGNLFKVAKVRSSNKGGGG